MWYRTKATELLGIDYPIMQGPFGGNLSSIQLVATVSNAGGLGGYGAYTLTPQEIVEVDQQIKEATGKPYNINLWVSDTDTIDGSVADEQFKQVQALFKPTLTSWESGCPKNLRRLSPVLKTRSK